MEQEQLLQVLETLRQLPHETEWVEFKGATRSFDFRELGRYFSALSNEANLKSQTCGWLIFGIADKSRAICGSHFRENPAHLDSLKQEIAEQTGNVSFRAIHVVAHPQGRVVMFEIPPAPPGMPVPFQGHWYGRNGESIGPLGVSKFETIRGQVQQEDWSAVTCPGASIAELDPDALATARKRFKAKHKSQPFVQEIEHCSDAVFLDRAKLTVNGELTRTAILLLGRPESTHRLSPAVGQITWKLEAEERAYEHFGPPFLLTTSELYSRIRNTTQKIDVPGRLVPYEVPKYEKWVILEALHNALAHQDYTRQARIIVTETIDNLQIESTGRFFDGQVSDYTLGKKTPARYRNRFLADAMAKLNMIDSVGYGIHLMFVEQRKRFYPLPDYLLDDPDKVVVSIPGKVIDHSYTALLMEKHDLPLDRVILLDRVQKRRKLTKAEAAMLRREQLIEGRYPAVYVAAHVAAATGDKAQYIRNRAFDDQHYRAMIVEYLRKYSHASREDLDRLLLDKLSDVLTDTQKSNKIRNLRKSLVDDGVIRNEGSRKFPRYVLTKKYPKNPNP